MYYYGGEIPQLKPEVHLKRYSKKLRVVEEEEEKMKQLPPEERDFSTLFTEAHWAAFHLISALMDSLQVPEGLKHRNHRSIKKSLVDSRVKKVVPEVETLLAQYDETIALSSKAEYGKSDAIGEEDVKKVKHLLQEIYTNVSKHFSKVDED